MKGTVTIYCCALSVKSDRVAAGSGFGQKKMSDPTLGSDSYDQTRPRVGQNPDVLTLGLSEKTR